MRRAFCDAIVARLARFLTFVHSHDVRPALVVNWYCTQSGTALVSKVAAFADAVQEVTPASVVPVISVENLVHRYENRTALNGISFDVRRAELFGLLGPNGSGKTTLFRILSTLMIPTAGRATIMGCDAVQEPARLRRQIGVVFQR